MTPQTTTTEPTSLPVRLGFAAVTIISIIILLQQLAAGNSFGIGNLTLTVVVVVGMLGTIKYRI